MQQQKKSQPSSVLNRTRSLGKQQQQKPQQQQQPQQISQQPKQGFTQLPSQKLTNIKTVDPFSDKSKQKTNSFAYVYNAGGIPCRVNHGCNTMKLQWNQGVEVDHLPYDPLMVTCFEGLIEEAHPYCFIAPNAIKDMLNEQNAQEKIIPILAKLVWPLRTALSSQNDKVFMSSLEILKLLSNKIGSHLNSNLKNLLVPLSKRMDKKNQKEIIQDVLRQILYFQYSFCLLNYQYKILFAMLRLQMGLLSQIYLSLILLLQNLLTLYINFIKMIQEIQLHKQGPETLKVIKSAIPTYTNM